MYQIAETNDEMEDYAANPEGRKAKAAIAQLSRMFPAVQISSIFSETPDMAMLTLDRTLAHMAHLDQKFELNQTFDVDFFNSKLNEAMLYKNWLNSDDETWPPAGLEYHSTVISGETEMEDHSVEGMKTVATAATPKVTRQPSTNSRYQRGKVIYMEDVKANKDRASTLKRMEAELGLNLATANVYYSKYKTECKLT